MTVPPITILVDADACPVKDEVYKIAERHGVNVVLAANSYMRIPRVPWVQLQVVSDGFDAADDWIVENASARTVVITADILLAQRCIEVGAPVIGSNGRPFTANSIGSAVATRAIMQDLRAGAGSKNDPSTAHIGGPSAFSKADRSRFLSALHDAVERLKRA